MLVPELGAVYGAVLRADVGSTEAVPVDERERADEASSGESYLTIAEMFIPVSKSARGKLEFLCFFAQSNRLGVIGPNAIRGHMTAIEAGILIVDIPVCELSSSACDLSFGLIQITRTPSSQRVVNAIEGLRLALEHAPDESGYYAVARSVAARLNLLINSADADLIMSASHHFEGQLRPPRILFLAPSGDGDRPQFYVKGGKLSAGPSRASATTWRGRTFLLAALGPDPGDSAERTVDIDQLVREHALIDPDVAGAANNKQADTEDRDRRWNRLTARFGTSGVQRLPAVTPIALEVAGNLSGIMSGEDGNIAPGFSEQLRQLRVALRHEFGFDIPTVRIRANPTDLPDGTFILMLDEIPIASDHVSLDSLLCDDTVDRLTMLNIKGEEAVNPATGGECAWVDLEYRDVLREARIKTWSASEYIVLRLGGELRKELAILVGIQTVSHLLREEMSAQAIARMAELRQSPGGLPRFTSVLQALLAERAPITRLVEISEQYLQCVTLPTYIIPEHIRAEVIGAALYGNAHDAPLFRLGPNFIDLLMRGVRYDGEAAVLALTPEDAQDALTAVRNEIGGGRNHSNDAALLVDDWRIRPFARKLVELEFPYLGVLARREAVDAESRTVSEIDTDPIG